MGSSQNHSMTHQESTSQGLTKNGNIGPCMHISESTNVKLQTYFTCEITLHVAHI